MGAMSVCKHDTHSHFLLGKKLIPDLVPFDAQLGADLNDDLSLPLRAPESLLIS